MAGRGRWLTVGLMAATLVVVGGVVARHVAGERRQNESVETLRYLLDGRDDASLGALDALLGGGFSENSFGQSALALRNMGWKAEDSDLAVAYGVGLVCAPEDSGVAAEGIEILLQNRPASSDMLLLLVRAATQRRVWGVEGLPDGVFEALGKVGDKSAVPEIVRYIARAAPTEDSHFGRATSSIVSAAAALRELGASPSQVLEEGIEGGDIARLAAVAVVGGPEAVGALTGPRGLGVRGDGAEQRLLRRQAVLSLGVIAGKASGGTVSKELLVPPEAGELDTLDLLLNLGLERRNGDPFHLTRNRVTGDLEVRGRLDDAGRLDVEGRPGDAGGTEPWLFAMVDCWTPPSKEYSLFWFYACDATQWYRYSFDVQRSSSGVSAICMRREEKTYPEDRRGWLTPPKWWGESD